MESRFSVCFGLLAVLSPLAANAMGKPASYSDFWSVVPRRGSGNCVVENVSVRIDEMRDPLNQERNYDVCAVPSSLILTDHGARAQFVTAMAPGGNYDVTYDSGFWEVNCRTMEVRAANGWGFSIKRPETSHWNYKAFRYYKSQNLWVDIGFNPSWFAWKPMSSIGAREQWLCAQWRRSR